MGYIKIIKDGVTVYDSGYSVKVFDEEQNQSVEKRYDLVESLYAEHALAKILKETRDEREAYIKEQERKKNEYRLFENKRLDDIEKIKKKRLGYDE